MGMRLTIERDLQSSATYMYNRGNTLYNVHTCTCKYKTSTNFRSRNLSLDHSAIRQQVRYVLNFVFGLSVGYMYMYMYMILYLETGTHGL